MNDAIRSFHADTFRRITAPEVFHLDEPGRPCSVWTGGTHRITDGACRCGKLFVLVEVRHPLEIARQKARDEADLTEQEIIDRNVFNSGGRD